jgi:hypothetical protein
MADVKPSIGFNIVNNALDQVIERIHAQNTQTTALDIHTVKKCAEKTAEKQGFLRVLEGYNKSIKEYAGSRMISEKDIHKIWDQANLMGQNQHKAFIKFYREQSSIINTVGIGKDFDQAWIRDEITSLKKLYFDPAYLGRLLRIVDEENYRANKPKLDYDAFEKGMQKGFAYLEKMSLNSIQKESYLEDIPSFD